MARIFVPEDVKREVEKRKKILKAANGRDITQGEVVERALRRDREFIEADEDDEEFLELENLFK